MKINIHLLINREYQMEGKKNESELGRNSELIFQLENGWCS